MGLLCTNGGRASVEHLESRRLLCSGGLESAEAHPGGEAAALAAPDTPAAAAVRNDATGHVTAAVARGRGMRGGEVVFGETAVVDGSVVAAWAVVSRKDGSVMAGGVSVPVALADTMPARGTGPAGAVASLDFPDVVRETTYFNHFEMHSEQQGHVAPPGSVNPNRNMVPHFDYHFYGIPEAEVWTIPLLRPPPALAPVPAERLPAGFTQPGFSQLQMGRHAGPAWQLTDPNPLSIVTLAGFLPDASRMHFIEPMISRDVLLREQDFPLEVPMPQVFDRDTRYPTRSDAVFHGGAHHFIYGDFVDTNPATAAAGADADAVPPAAGASSFAAGGSGVDGDGDEDGDRHLEAVLR
jgi:hypothetical protein